MELLVVAITLLVTFSLKNSHGEFFFRQLNYAYLFAISLNEER